MLGLSFGTFIIVGIFVFMDFNPFVYMFGIFLFWLFFDRVNTKNIIIDKDYITIYKVFTKDKKFAIKDLTSHIETRYINHRDTKFLVLKHQTKKESFEISSPFTEKDLENMNYILQKSKRNKRKSGTVYTKSKI